MKLSTLKTFLLDLIFPRHCLNCQEELPLKQDSFICKSCFDKIALISGVQCHICGLRNAIGTCRQCRQKTPLNGLFAASQYQDPILKKMIHNFKYKSIESLKKPLAKLIVNYLTKENLINLTENSRHPMSTGHRMSGTSKMPILVPIPLTLRRKINRGFNQSELLAKELGIFLNYPVFNLLKRKGSAAPQAEISDWQKRKENVFGAFVINQRFKPLSDDRQQAVELKKIKIVILVDDVSTSGATLEEAAQVLKDAGVKKIYGLVIAKG